MLETTEMRVKNETQTRGQRAADSVDRNVPGSLGPARKRRTHRWYLLGRLPPILKTQRTFDRLSRENPAAHEPALWRLVLAGYDDHSGW